MKENNETGHSDILDELPAFANVRNRKIFEEVKAKQKELERLINNGKEQKSRILTLNNHTKNVLTEIEYLKQQVASAKKERDLQHHLTTLTDAELSNLRTEVKLTEEQKSKTISKIISVKAEIYQTTKELESLRKDIGVKETELTKWILAQKQKEEDMLLLESFHKQDVSRLSELLNEKESIKLTNSKLESELRECDTERRTLEIKAEQLAQELDAENLRKETISSKLMTALEVSQKKHQNILKLAQEYNHLTEELEEVSESCAAKSFEIERLERDKKRKETEYEINRKQLEALRTNIIKLEAAEKKQEEERKLLSTQVETLQNGNDVKQKQLVQLQEAKTKIEKSLETGVKELKMSIEKSLQQSNENNNSLVSSNEAHKYLRDQSAQLQELSKKIKESRNIVYQQNIKLSGLNETVKNSDVEKTLAEAQYISLNSALYALDMKRASQEAMVYNASFRLSQSERKLKFVKGERSETEKLQLNKRIETLTRDLEAKKTELSKVSQDRNKIDAEVKQFRTVTEKVGLELANCEAINHELTLKTGKLQARKRLLEDNFVNSEIKANQVQLRNKELKTEMMSLITDIYSVESEVFELDSQLTKRKQEAQCLISNKEMKLRLLKDIRSKYTKEENQLQANIGNLEKRFQILRSNFAFELDSDCSETKEEERTQTYFIIKNAQKKEELRASIEKLGKKAKSLEKELHDLDLASKHLRDLNIRQRENLKPVNQGNPNWCELVKLEEEVNQQETCLVQKQREHDRLENEINNNKTHIQRAESTLSGLLEQLAEETNQLEQERLRLEKIGDRKQALQKKAVCFQNENKELWDFVQASEKSKKLNDIVELLRSFSLKHPLMAESLHQRCANFGIDLN
eukprot:snap_masked-scaffold_34-processed-gene-0.55-mRNA-1 protein AED:1.00 eAED:1.00 QI:0/-1/0/0/-1/1/1/0/866